MKSLLHVLSLLWAILDALTRKGSKFQCLQVAILAVLFTGAAYGQCHKADTLEYWESLRLLPATVTRVDEEGVTVAIRDKHRILVKALRLDTDTFLHEPLKPWGVYVFIYCDQHQTLKEALKIEGPTKSGLPSLSLAPSQKRKE